MILRVFILLLWALPGLAAAEKTTPPLGPCDAWFPASGRAKAVVVVAHGMNLKPTAMDDISRRLTASGIEVFRPAFTGHCGEKNNNYLFVTADLWREDAKRFYQIAQARAQAMGVPLHLAAYSFSALVFHSLAKEMPFVRRVYLAPALSLKFWYPALALFFRMVPGFTFSSRNLREYAVNAVSGARPIVAMDDILKDWRRQGQDLSAAPTLLFVDPEDELVSYEGLKEMAAAKSSWRFEPISIAATTLPETAHHLIVDKAALGESEWNRMILMAEAFLTSQETAQSSKR